MSFQALPLHNLDMKRAKSTLLGESSKIDDILVNLELPSPSREHSVFNNVGDGEEAVKTGPNCLQFSLSSLAIIAVIIILLIFCRENIHKLLYWLEGLDVWLGILIFIALFTCISFPMTWGYLLLNIAAGYLYGAILGTLIVTLSVVIGISIAHFTIQKFLYNFVSSRLAQNEHMRAVMKVVEGKQGFKVVALSRLTPIPFGLQNGLFAITDINPFKYVVASALGLLPTQVLNSYIGSTLRSMEDVLTDDSNQTTGWIVFITQIIFTICLMMFVVRKARNELKKAVEDQDCDIEEKNGLMQQKNGLIQVQCNGEVKTDQPVKKNNHVSFNHRPTVPYPTIEEVREQDGR